ncbi:uncharacterized protein NECHADRAFT_82889 [Fusarium vanettenii 77-13-4]|uniref:Endonuclease/exonuclease/phosphatase domain-containing protein n=1 Tax=Fusarium vanettenii (strain ATCC MYA-4622 / CBS 123669 / FGSC 9596 / NRRL 45880 / 77-13-4) TaxID=660122 RepID=C7YX46_FUSV7|nr:uncharacterized protein NECHADRAFT_82889 [Fusarium vanettenii 77-13-4]EEU43521.1 hypothetical protein NECHADRAFT_82889 [Fusarium vanettenii 77-13-4]
MATRHILATRGASILWQRPAPLPGSFLSRHLISSISHWLHSNNSSKAYIPHHLVRPQHIEPLVFHPHSATWQPVTAVNPGLSRGSVLTTASWNLNWSDPDPAARMLASLAHLEEKLGAEPQNLAVMLQEVSPASLCAMLGHPWVQRNFVLSNDKPPEVPRRVTLDASSVLRQSAQRETSYFTVMMASKNLPVTACFRATLVTNMGRDVLAMDIHTLSQEETSNHQECIRLCTTHLESLFQGKEYRRGQLAVISDLLKHPILPGSGIIGGVVGGDMNAIDKSEHAYHKESQVDLGDIWEDSQMIAQQRGICQHEEGGGTWGDRSSRHRGPKRFDKFLYTGAIESLAFEDSPDCLERVRRFGAGLKTAVELWELEREDTEVVGGQAVKRLRNEYVSEERFNTLSELGFLRNIRARQIRMDARVSDHCAILARIRIV